MPDLGLEVLLKGNNLLRLLDGLWIAVEISLLSIAISIPLGILLGILMTRKNRLVRFLTKFYLEFIRIMPQLVLLFLVFFGTTRSMGWNLPGETAAVIVFVMWGTAEMGDLVRSALLSIPGHQYESSKALGLSRRQTYFYIILPQTLRRLIPVSINLITRMIKTTSLILMIGVVEVLKVGAADYRGKPHGKSECSIWGFFGDFNFIFCHLLVCQHDSPVLGKEMELAYGGYRIRD